MQFSDDASTGTFLNEETAIALGLQSAYERVIVRVLNETLEYFDTIPVAITLESADGQTSMASQEEPWLSWLVRRFLSKRSPVRYSMTLTSASTFLIRVALASNTRKTEH